MMVRADFTSGDVGASFCTGTGTGAGTAAVGAAGGIVGELNAPTGAGEPSPIAARRFSMAAASMVR